MKHKWLWTFFLLIPCFLQAKEPNRYSVITLENETPYRIFYVYRWGEGDREWKNSIEPHGTYVHWWPFKYPNENYAPWFYLQMESEADWHKLGSFFAPNHKAKSGRVYFFRDEGEGRIREIHLYEKLYTE